MPQENTGTKQADISSAIELPDGRIICGRNSALLSSASAAILNAVKALANLPDVNIMSPSALEPIQKLKTGILGDITSELRSDEALIALTVSAAVNPMAGLALEQLSKLRGCQMHITAIPSHADAKTLRKLGLQVTSERRCILAKEYISINVKSSSYRLRNYSIALAVRCELSTRVQ